MLSSAAGFGQETTATHSPSTPRKVDSFLPRKRFPWDYESSITSNSSTCLLNVYMSPRSGEGREDLESKAMVLEMEMLGMGPPTLCYYDRLHALYGLKELRVGPNLERSQSSPLLSPNDASDRCWAPAHQIVPMLP